MNDRPAGSLTGTLVDKPNHVVPGSYRWMNRTLFLSSLICHKMHD